MLYLHISFLEYTGLAKLSFVLIIFLCWHRVFLCQLVSRVLFSSESYFLDIRTCLNHLIDSIVFFMEQLSIEYLQNQSMYVMLYITKLQHDKWDQSSELIYTQKFKKLTCQFQMI